jgi:cytochrome P450
VATAPTVAFNPFEPGFFENPYEQYRLLREHDPVHHSMLGPWFLFRHEDVRGIITNLELSVEFANVNPDALMFRQEMFESVLPGVTDTMRERGTRAILNIDPPDHTRLRRLVSKAFTPRTVEDLRPRAQAIVDESLAKAEGAGEMDLVADLAFHLPVTVISEMLGMPEGDRDRLRGWSHELAGTLDPLLSPEQIQASFEASVHMVEYLTDVIAHKREHPGDDLLTRMIQAEDEGDMLSEQELIDNVLLLYIAGHETTVNLIGNGVLALLRHRDQLERLVADPSLDANAVEELLRYDSPVQFTRRITLEPMEVAGHTVEPGSVVLTCLGSANRDPAFWGDDADSLDLGREHARQQVSFGSGAHYCLGAALARMEGQVSIGTLIRRFPAVAQAGEAVPNNRVVLRGLDALPLTLR